MKKGIVTLKAVDYKVFKRMPKRYQQVWLKQARATGVRKAA